MTAKPNPPPPPPGGLSKRTAKRILGQMGENGKPPEIGISHVNVGNDSYLTILDRVYVQEVLGEMEGSSFKLVQGTYGAGKTHFLYCVRDLAWRRNLLAACVTISPKECPLDKPRRVYQAVAQQLELPRAGEDEAVRGIDDIVRHRIEQRLEEEGAEAVRMWADKSLARATIQKHSFRDAVVAYVLARLDGDHGTQRTLAAWLRGEDISLSLARKHGVYELISDQNGFSMLRSLVQVAHKLGFEGSALLFDEAERRLSIEDRQLKSTQVAMDHLRELIDLCGRSELPRALVVYAVTPAFTHEILPEYPALQQRLGSPIQYLSASNPKAPLIDLEALDLNPRKFLRGAGLRLARVAERAYDWSPERAMLEANVDRLVEAVTRQMLEVSHRRLFVKLWIRLLDDLRISGERVLSDDEVEGLVREEQTVLLQEEEAVTFLGMTVGEPSG